jgi:hypothetical protein
VSRQGGNRRPQDNGQLESGQRGPVVPEHRPSVCPHRANWTEGCGAFFGYPANYKGRQPEEAEEEEWDDGRVVQETEVVVAKVRYRSGTILCPLMPSSSLSGSQSMLAPSVAAWRVRRGDRVQATFD